MARTLSHRSKLVQEKYVSEDLDTYPCLRIEKEVISCILMYLRDSDNLLYLTCMNYGCVVNGFWPPLHTYQKHLRNNQLHNYYRLRGLNVLLFLTGLYDQLIMLHVKSMKAILKGGR